MRIILAAVLAAAWLAPALATPTPGQTKCRLDFTLEGWSAVYQKASGRGTVKCENGQVAKVTLEAEGVGATAGKMQVDEGIGRFSSVADISEVFGTYARVQAHAGAATSASATALTKGQVSLSLAGTGHGFDLGVVFGKFEVNRAGK